MGKEAPSGVAKQWNLGTAGENTTEPRSAAWIGLLVLTATSHSLEEYSATFRQSINRRSRSELRSLVPNLVDGAFKHLIDARAMRIPVIRHAFALHLPRMISTMSQQTGRLAGKTAVVTGAASGIGLAVTQLFLSEGAKVLAVDFSDKNIESAKSQLQADGFDSGSYTFHNADVADEESVIAFVEKGVTELGGLDIVVLNAGIGFIKPIVDTNAEEYDRLMRINARGRK